MMWVGLVGKTIAIISEAFHSLKPRLYPRSHFIFTRLHVNQSRKSSGTVLREKKIYESGSVDANQCNSIDSNGASLIQDS